jgi:hypothetical protein
MQPTSAQRRSRLLCPSLTRRTKVTRTRRHRGAAGRTPNRRSTTIVAGNHGDFDVMGNGSDGEFTSMNSLLGTVEPGTIVHDQGGTITGSDPLLAPLADNGGPTLTHALLQGSPAIDAGPDPVPTFTGNEFDQRGPGFVRVFGTRVDIGAYEAGEFPLVVLFTG